jgi:hypothetical protein
MVMTVFAYSLTLIMEYPWVAFPVPLTYILGKLTLPTSLSKDKNECFNPRPFAQEAFPFIDFPQLDTIIWGFTNFPYCDEAEYEHQIGLIKKAMEDGQQIVHILETAVKSGNDALRIEMAEKLGLNLTPEDVKNGVGVAL